MIRRAESPAVCVVDAIASLRLSQTIGDGVKLAWVMTWDGWDGGDGWEWEGCDGWDFGCVYRMVSRGGWDAWLDVMVADTLSPLHPGGRAAFNLLGLR